MFTCGSIVIFAAGFISSNGHPIDPKVILPLSNGFGITIVGAALLISTVIALIACTCCKQRRDGFKEFRNPTTAGHIGFTNTLSELAIFPPPATVQQPHPLTDNEPQQINNHSPSRPAAFSCAVPSVTDWFIDRNGNFPRQQLFYQKEIGKGWFGKVVKGEARGAKVVVRILREDATPEEKGYFLHEAKPFRDLKHKNISRLYGRCLEHDPFLLLFEYCTNGDLKSFLVTNSSSRNAITEQKISLKMMIDVTEGLKFMNEHGFIHTDLAARNCLVASDLTVKIGDYGTSVDKYKNEYYIVGDIAVPIRWCAPETLTCTQTTIETKEVTEGGNVWSLAVLLWEIAEFGKLPYTDLTDEEVITRVLVQGSVRLPPPNCSFGHYLHNVMTLCWRTDNRTNIEQILMMLMYLKNNPFQESDFESRWRALKPNTVAVVDNHTPIHSPRHTELAQRPHLTTKLEFDSGVDLEIKPTDENPDSCRTSTPNTVSPQLSVASEDIFHPVQHKSPSMTNLKGSLEDVAQFDSWLMGVEQKTEEDRNFVKNISEAIKNLDETLAMEKTSSSSQDSSMEGNKKPLLDFKLGPTGNEKKGDSSSSDTEEETWRNRIERGEFTEKVKEKSKSVTDLMVLTHIDSEGSESDSLPSLTRQYSVKKTTVKGVSYTGIGFGSEGNIRNAVLSEELQDKLKQLTNWKTEAQSFLVKGASEKNNKNLLSTAVKEPLPTSVLVGDEESLLPPISCSITTNPIAAISEDKCSPVKSFSSDGALLALDHAVISNTYSEEPDVNIERKPVNNVSVMKEENNVNSDCTKGSLVDNELSVISNARILKGVDPNDCRQLVVDSKQSASSHFTDNSVPEIVITESETSQIVDELEPSIDMEYVVVKPRKFVFVCKDSDLLSDSSDDEDNASQDIPNIKPQQETSVILGSCEEYTLDYFKGLKTTFTPNVSYAGISETWAEHGTDFLDEHGIKGRSDIEEKLLADKDLADVALMRLSDKTVNDSFEGSKNHLNEENIINKASNPNVSVITDQEKEENILKNGMNFNKAVLHIIDSFIDNERAYTALSVESDNSTSIDISTNLNKSCLAKEVGEKNNLPSHQADKTSSYEVGSSVPLDNFSDQFLLRKPLNENGISLQETPSHLHTLEDPKELLIANEKDEKNLYKQIGTNRPSSNMERHFSSENSTSDNLVETIKFDDTFSESVDLTSPSTVETFSSRSSPDEFVFEGSTLDENIFSKSLEHNSPSKTENNFSIAASPIKHILEPPKDESMLLTFADLVSSSKIENILSTKECILESSLSSVVSNSLFDVDRALIENSSKENCLGTELDKNTNFSNITEIKNSFLSEDQLVKSPFDDSVSSPCKNEASFSSETSLDKELEIPIKHKIESSSLDKIESNFSLGTLQSKHSVNSVLNKTSSCELTDHPSKIELLASSGSTSEENSVEIQFDENVQLSSTSKIETDISSVISPEEHLLPSALNNKTSLKSVGLDGISEIENLVSEVRNSEEHEVGSPVEEDKFLTKFELSSPCKNKTSFSSEISYEECSVNSASNKSSAFKDLDVKNHSTMETSVSSGNSSEEQLLLETPVDNNFSEKLSSPCKIENTFSSEELLVEAPFPFNQPEPLDIHSNITSVKAKSLDSFLSPKNGYEHFVTLRNGLYLEDDHHLTNFVPVFNMTESVSENAFMNQNLYYDPYFSVDSGHSSDRCIEQDKKMNDLKNRLEDVVKSGSDFQLKNSEEEYGGKLLTPDDERSSDSGFRDKGSLSESVEDTCDEKYNLEDIDAELDEFTLKNIEKEDHKYFEQFAEPERETTGWFLHARPESSVANFKESGWLSQSTEDEERLPLTIDAEFAAAIRNELKEKLPCAQQVEKPEEDASPEQEPATDKFTYPSQLSPILEEQESNQSSLQLNDCSPVFILPPPEIKTDSFKEDIVKAFESLESSKNGLIMEDLEDGNGPMVFNDDKIIVDDDVLIVDTETNEVTLIESPKPQSHLAFILTKKEPEVFIDNDSPEVNSDVYVLTPDNAPLTPNSVNSDSHSSPENANMSGLFLSPCSIRSDLFDSGPPSLPFDLGQSLEEVEDIPACEETVTENLSLGICNGDVSTPVTDKEMSILKGNKKELIDNKKIEEMEVNIQKDFTDLPLEPLGAFKDHEENIKNSNGIEVTLDPLISSDLNSNKSISDEKVLKHLRAEVEIDRLLSRSNKENEIENTNHLNSNSTLKNDWLKDLFTNSINTTEINCKEDKNHVNTNLRKTDWPTIEELVYEKRPEKNEQNNCLKPNITSTLALMSPDLSSADSKSIASSFSSTPSSDENKTVATSAEESNSLKLNEKLVKPNSLNLKSDASGAPMPSPEDAEKGWRPTICQLMELTDQAAADGEEMTTSFIEPDENGIYTPDWESDISEEQSSSSGEFVWKNDEIMGGGMERIEEEDEDCSSCNDSDTSSETSSGAEFVPSTWNAMAIPMKSALKVNVPQKKNEQKRVVFKKEKYQCIYEYPREESDNEEEEFGTTCGWETPPAFDYSVFADWELGEGEIISTPIDSVDSDNDDNKKPKKEEPELDFYRLDYNPGPHVERPWSDSLPEDDADFSPLAADLAPVRLGDLRHTKATLRLELPQLRPDQGEASILDSVSDAPANSGHQCDGQR